MDQPLKSPGQHALEEAFHRLFELSRSEPQPALALRLDRLQRLRAVISENEARFEQARQAEPLMGWTSSTDMRGQVKLFFDTMEEAVAYAQREGLPYRVEEPHDAKRRTISYSDNFRFNRVGQWTH